MLQGNAHKLNTSTKDSKLHHSHTEDESPHCIPHRFGTKKTLTDDTLHAIHEGQNYKYKRILQTSAAFLIAMKAYFVIYKNKFHNM